MLHFLAGVALCIFIGERIVHYTIAYRLNRALRRNLQWPPPEPNMRSRDHWAKAIVVVLATVVFVLMAAVAPPH